MRGRHDLALTIRIYATTMFTSTTTDAVVIASVLRTRTALAQPGASFEELRLDALAVQSVTQRSDVRLHLSMNERV